LNYTITSTSAVPGALNLMPRENYVPPTNEAQIHVSCTHKGDDICDVVRDALKTKFSKYEPEFVKMPVNQRIRPDERTLIKLKHVTPELLTTIAEQTSEIKCVHKVRVLLNN